MSDYNHVAYDLTRLGSTERRLFRLHAEYALTRPMRSIASCDVATQRAGKPSAGLDWKNSGFPCHLLGKTCRLQYQRKGLVNLGVLLHQQHPMRGSTNTRLKKLFGGQATEPPHTFFVYRNQQ